MAFSLSNRFPATLNYFPIHDPGTYQFEKSKLKHNTAPFLSNAPRKTEEKSTLWTQATYDAAVTQRIPNITSFKSKQRRFTYETFSDMDFKETLCKCDIDISCVSPNKNEALNEVAKWKCQGKVKRRLFKGRGRNRTLGDEGLSIPSKNDHGFSISRSGLQKRLRKEIKDNCPIFYDAQINDFSAYYQGCKWSLRTSRRIQKSSEVIPGPTDYYLVNEPTEDDICIEKLRSYKRNISKQPRFMELVQQQNIREGYPGPGSYDPTRPKGHDLKMIGSKSKRFPSSKNENLPGPAEYKLRRSFDPIDPPRKFCQAILPASTSFGVKSQRFRQQQELKPSPATYNVNHKVCQFMHCSTAPFGSSAVRFKPNIINDRDENELFNKYETVKKVSSYTPNMWFFKSKTVRIKSLIKDVNKPSPADILPKENISIRSPQLQYALPFYTSERRFNPWYNWIPIHGMFETPSPCDYDTAKPICTSAFKHGPMFRTKRFPMNSFATPAPNTYKIPSGIECILKTHNRKLIANVKKKYTFSSNLPVQKQVLNYNQKERLLFQECINILEPTETFDYVDKPTSTKNNIVGSSSSLSTPNKKQDQKANNLDCVSNKDVAIIGGKTKPKLLRSFLYSYQIPSYF